MQIQVKCSCGEEKCPEWAILELQGVVEAQPSFKDHLQNLQIGSLCRPTSQETYTFTVGYHELTGTKVPLKKPMLVLKKIKLDTEEEKDNISSSMVELDVIGVIRQRILFKTRPKALISNIDADLIGLILEDTDMLGRVFIEPGGSSWYPASKEVNEAVRESVMRLFTYPCHEWWDIPIVSKQAMFQEFKTCCYVTSDCTF
ncbi:putative uncharacterized protein DDB_G0287975 isoform X3 [Capsicum annuum]|uniref:putative uncharacterized protein DDB_G0287975 isoform X3 n=1 Tax=Capsicum annuum TaxID=4072 RepID=UPI0007BF9C41|nr:putative uncharacterized protein DDB_G0287975 isoform X3 [Capsicum annuum]